MSTLPSHVSLRKVATVLHAARVVGSGAWKRAKGPSMPPPSESNLGTDIIELFSLLRDRNIQYLLVGGVALLKYIDGRNTQDIDLLLSIESLAQLPEISTSDQNESFARGRFRGLQVDLLLTSDPLFQRVQKEFATTHTFDEMSVRCATVEGLIVLKLYALPALYRRGDGQRIAIYETDILMLAQRHGTKLAPLLEIVRPHVEPNQYHELSNIAKEIEARIARMKRVQEQSPSNGSAT